MLIVALLAGFGLWQCGTGMTASPAVPMSHHMAMPVTLPGHADLPDSPTPAGLAALCLTVLACVVAAFTLTDSQARLPAPAQRPAPLSAPSARADAPAPALAQLCVCRT